MKTVVFASTKGGVGKTSLAFSLGIEAAKSHTVYFADMDPQKSLVGICERRAQQPGLVAENPMLLDNVASIGRAVADIMRTEYARDLLIVDTPGSFVDIIRDAIAAADCVVLPVQPSPLDVLAQEEVAKLANELGKWNRTLFVLNRVDGRVNVDDTLRKIGPMFPNQPVKIGQKVDYSRSLIGGLSGAEVNNDCKREIEALLASVQAVIRKADDEKARHDHSAAVFPARRAAG